MLQCLLLLLLVPLLVAVLAHQQVPPAPCSPFSASKGLLVPKKRLNTREGPVSASKL
jgi:hypothetical protein